MPQPISLRLLRFGLCLGAFTLTSAAQSLLVVNQGDANLSIIDPVTGHEAATVSENIRGVHGHEIATSADGRTAFMPIYGSTGVGKPGIDGHEMLIIDLPSRKIVGDLDFGHSVRPHQPTLDPATGLLYVTTELDKAIAIIDPTTRKVVGSIPTGAEQSHMLAISHDGHRGYTANVGPGSVSVLDMTARKTITVIPIAGEVQRISVSTDDKLVFTSDYTKPQLAVIDTATNKLKTFVPLPGLGYGSAPTPDGRSLLIAIPTPPQLAVVDLATLKVVHTIDLPAAPQEVVIAPGGHTAYVSCNTSGKVAEIDLQQWKVKQLISAGKGADGLAWAK
jgi:DNA-binding beta-propeller fold protein YncE